MLRKIYDVVFRNKAAAWTAAFTCVLCIFSYLLWKVSQDANDSSTITQAASLSPVGPAVTPVLSDDGKTLTGYHMYMGWNNAGTTAAKSVVMQSNIYAGPNAPSKATDFSKLPQAETVTIVLGPRQMMNATPVTLSLKDIEDAQDGKKRVFLWGWATYRDMFSATPRLSEYCLNMTGATWGSASHSDPATTVNFNDVPCGTFFCFNEECADYKERTK